MEGEGTGCTCCLQKWGTSCGFSAIVKEACQLLTGEWIDSVRPNMHPIVQNCLHWICHQQIFWSPFCFVGKLCFIPVNPIRTLCAMQINDSVESFSIFKKYKIKISPYWIEWQYELSAFFSYVCILWHFEMLPLEQLLLLF